MLNKESTEHGVDRPEYFTLECIIQGVITEETTSNGKCIMVKYYQCL